jgi:hypothetical protein
MQMDISKTCRKRGLEMIFLSHANPEDNLFTRWLALRLARRRVSSVVRFDAVARR